MSLRLGTNRQTYGQTDRQTDNQTEKHKLVIVLQHRSHSVYGLLVLVRVCRDVVQGVVFPWVTIGTCEVYSYLQDTWREQQGFGVQQNCLQKGKKEEKVMWNPTYFKSKQLVHIFLKLVKFKKIQNYMFLDVHQRTVVYSLFVFSWMVDDLKELSHAVCYPLGVERNTQEWKTKVP